MCATRRGDAVIEQPPGNGVAHGLVRVLDDIWRGACPRQHGRHITAERVNDFDTAGFGI
jgi:hypothetical protein